MVYGERFELADEVVKHLDGAVASVQDDFITSRYVGFVAVSAVTVYEQAIKDIFIAFSSQKNGVFGEFVIAYFQRINGRISSREIVKEYLPRFGEKYVKRFQKKRDQREKEILKSGRNSMLTSYNNIITWRNQFAHEGRLPNTVTFREVREAYDTGKHVIHCLAETMVR